MSNISRAIAEYTRYVETIITHCFASQTVDNFSAIETKRAIVDSVEQMADWGTAIGGTAAIVSGVENVIRKHGGEIVLRTKVARDSAGKWPGDRGQAGRWAGYPRRGGYPQRRAEPPDQSGR